MADLPEGTVSFLFSDVEGSTRLLERHGSHMGVALTRHHALVEEIVDRHGGAIFETVGDAVYAAFAAPADAVATSLEIHLRFAAEDWGPIQRLAVRIAIHTGQVERRGDHYFGSALFRTARLQALSYGEQTLVSGVSARLAGDRLPEGASLRELGTHRLKDLAEPELVYQLVHPGLRDAFPALKSLDVHAHNLPVQLSSFVGREAELAEVGAVLDSHRLVTLLGPGGIGKTRLALQVAAERIERHPDGVWFVDLSALSDPELVPGAIATTLGLRDQPGQPMGSTLVDHLRSRRSLLVLDNLEQLLPAAAATVSELLGGAGELHIVVTSRAPLRIRGEYEYAVPPLASGDPRRLERKPPPAVALFLERARAIRADIGIDAVSGPLVAEICAALDGLPLAIELAASRVRVFSLEVLRHRLASRLPLLTGGLRDAPARQQTLRAAIAWSEELLSEPERHLFARLGAFVGGFSLEAAEAVAGPDLGVETIGALTTLVEHSLVRQIDSPTHDPRYAMLETIREYAAERLEASAEAEAVRRHRTEYFARLADRVAARAVGGSRSTRPSTDAELTEQVALDYQNLRASLTDAMQTGDQARALRLAGSLALFWESRGPWKEACEVIDEILDMHDLPSNVLVGDLLHRSGNLHVWLGNRDVARTRYRRALAIRRLGSDPDRVARTIYNLGLAAETFEESLEHLDEALALRLKHGLGYEAGLRWAIAKTLWLMDDLPAARGQMELALRLARRDGDHAFVFDHLNGLAELTRLEGDADQAEELYRAADLEAASFGYEDDRLIAAAGLARCAVGKGRVDEAADRLAGAAALVPRTEEWSERAAVMYNLLGAVADLECAKGNLLAAAQAWGAHEVAIGLDPNIDTPVHRRERLSIIARAKRNAGETAFQAAWDQGSSHHPHEWPELLYRLLALSSLHED